MSALRAMICHRHRLVMLLVAMTLALKMAVPAGFMPVSVDSRIVVSLCSGTGPATMVLTIPQKGQTEKGDHRGKDDAPCAFSALSAPSLSGAHALLLAAAILFIMVLGVRPSGPRETPTATYLRPPLRGPPQTV